MTYIKHFNEASDDYNNFRPHYPKRLFDYLSTIVGKEACVWDCGTGNGQAALALAGHFERVFATDINFKQIEVGTQKDNLHFICCPAEQTPFLDRSFDLITVAQALHWFDLQDFYKEVKRVAKPSEIIAAWCYSLGTINADIDPLVRMLYRDILGDKFWPKERRYIDAHYSTIPFPFKKMRVPEFTIEKKFNFTTFIGYLNTWSAVKEYQKRQNENPIDSIHDQFLFAWGDPTEERMMRYRVHMLVGLVH